MDFLGQIQSMQAVEEGLSVVASQRLVEQAARGSSHESEKVNEKN